MFLALVILYCFIIYRHWQQTKLKVRLHRCHWMPMVNFKTILRISAGARTNWTTFTFVWLAAVPSMLNCFQSYVQCWFYHMATQTSKAVSRSTVTFLWRICKKILWSPNELCTMPWLHRTQFVAICTWVKCSLQGSAWTQEKESDRRNTKSCRKRREKKDIDNLKAKRVKLEQETAVECCKIDCEIEELEKQHKN